MAKYLRYMGEFLSRAGVCWRAEILQESNSAFDEIGVLTFEATEALVIEYPNTAKEDVICGSTATIQIESPGDRTYEDYIQSKPALYVWTCTVTACFTGPAPWIRNFTKNPTSAQLTT